MIIKDAQGLRLYDAMQVMAEPTGRVFRSRLPNVGTDIQLVSDTAYFVYVGRAAQAVTLQYVEFYVNVAGTGPQSDELSATPQAANFTLSASPSSRSVARGGTTTFTVTVTPSGGFNGLVSLSASANPKAKGTTFSFNPQTLNVFPDEFESKAWTPVLHALAGVDLGLARFLMVNGEARYTWARGPMGRDYVGFHRIDLSGLSLTAGLSLRL